jgi:hypothetical protein
VIPLSIDQTDKAEYLKQKLEEEEQKHRDNKEAEKERHKQVVKSIKYGAGLTEVMMLYEQAKELHRERKELLNDLEESMITIIKKANPYKSNKTLGNTVTLRDGEVYQYNDTDKASLTDLKNVTNYKSGKRDLKQVLDSDMALAILDSLRELKKLDIKDTSFRGAYNRRTFEIDDGEIDASVKLRRLDRPYVDDTSIKLTSDSVRHGKRQVEHVSQLTQLYQHVNSELQDSIDTIEEVTESITNRHKKHLTALKL